MTEYQSIGDLKSIHILGRRLEFKYSGQTDIFNIKDIRPSKSYYKLGFTQFWMNALNEIIQK